MFLSFCFVCFFGLCLLCLHRLTPLPLLKLHNFCLISVRRNYFWERGPQKSRSTGKRRVNKQVQKATYEKHGWSIMFYYFKQIIRKVIYPFHVQKWTGLATEFNFHTDVDIMYFTANEASRAVTACGEDGLVFMHLASNRGGQKGS